MTAKHSTLQLKVQFIQNQIDLTKELHRAFRCHSNLGYSSQEISQVALFQRTLTEILRMWLLPLKTFSTVVRETDILIVPPNQRKDTAP